MKKNAKKNIIAPVALDKAQYDFLKVESENQGVSIGHIIRRSIMKLSADPGVVYPDNGEKKTYRAPTFLLSDSELMALKNLQGEKTRNSVIRNAIWAMMAATHESETIITIAE